MQPPAPEEEMVTHSRVPPASFFRRAAKPRGWLRWAVIYSIAVAT